MILFKITIIHIIKKNNTYIIISDFSVSKEEYRKKDKFKTNKLMGLHTLYLGMKECKITIENFIFLN